MIDPPTFHNAQTRTTIAYTPAAHAAAIAAAAQRIMDQAEQKRASLVVDGWPEWKRNLCRLERELVK